MMKVVVLPALGENCAKIQVLEGNTVITTVDVNETLGRVRVSVNMFDEDAHVFTRDLSDYQKDQT